MYNYARSDQQIIEDAGITTHVVISEIQISGGAGASSQDFVELYNPSNSGINLNNWNLRKRNNSGNESSLVLIQEDKIIPAHGYFLWGNTDGDFANNIGADVSNGNNISENNSIALLNASDQIIDQVAWGSGTNQFTEGSVIPDNPGTNQNLERKARSTSTVDSMSVGGIDEFKGNSYDSNNNTADFILRATSQPQNSSSPAEKP
ncbi:lamin tail domain-containing protein [Candidatus Gottesmanbacteria bacterium]|nr:lamin tail domain-containing protein [Candidatus Gottesmanbacteria bacterium]